MKRQKAITKQHFPQHLPEARFFATMQTAGNDGSAIRRSRIAQSSSNGPPPTASMTAQAPTLSQPPPSTRSTSTRRDGNDHNNRERNRSKEDIRASQQQPQRNRPPPLHDAQERPRPSPSDRRPTMTADHKESKEARAKKARRERARREAARKAYKEAKAEVEEEEFDDEEWQSMGNLETSRDPLEHPKKYPEEEADEQPLMIQAYAIPEDDSDSDASKSGAKCCACAKCCSCCLGHLPKACSIGTKCIKLGIAIAGMFVVTAGVTAGAVCGTGNCGATADSTNSSSSGMALTFVPTQWKPLPTAAPTTLNVTKAPTPLDDLFVQPPTSTNTTSHPSFSPTTTLVPTISGNVSE